MTDPVTGLRPAEGRWPSVVVEELVWEDATGLRAGSAQRESTRSVGFLAVPDRGTWCTAVLVGEEALLTASTCLNGPDELQGAQVHFRRETGIPQAEWDSFSCEDLLLDGGAAEFMLIGCAGGPGLTHGVTRLRAGHLAPDTDVYLVQQACSFFDDPECHPNKRLAHGSVVRARDEIWVDADAVAGSLGGPIFASSGEEIVALHLGGAEAFPANRATRASDILETIQGSLPALVVGSRASVFGAPPPPPDPFEPNDEEEQATMVNPGFSTQAAWIGHGDRDVFRIELLVGDVVEVEVEFDHTQGDIDVVAKAEGLDGPTVASSVSATDNERLRFVATEDGTHFVVVYGYQGSMNEYVLTFR